MSAPHEKTAVIFDRPSPLAEPAVPPGRARTRIVAASVLAALFVLTVVLLIGEWIARAQVERAIAAEVVAASDLPATQRVTAAVTGPVLPQLLTGRFAQVVVASENVNVGAFGGDVTIEFTDVPVGDGAEIGTAHGEVHISSSQAEALFGGALDVVFSDTEMSFGVDLSAGGQSVPLLVSVTPRFDAGRVSTAFSSMTLGDTTVTAAQAAEQLGPETATALQPVSTCIAEAMPLGVRVTDISTREREMVLTFEVDPRITVDLALQQPGACG